VDKLTLSGGEVVAKKQKKMNQMQNNDAAALGNADVMSEIEVKSGEITRENNNNLHDDPDFYIGQNPDETK
jgi:hypothetical protein